MSRGDSHHGQKSSSHPVRQPSETIPVPTAGRDSSGNSPQSKPSHRTAPSRNQKAFSSDLVFVHGSTSSSVLSPTTHHHLEGLRSTAAAGVQFSPHHLSNSFGLGTDTIDSTGLLPLESEGPLEFHSQVFTGSASQDSVPHFSPRESEGTFHVNLTQTSQTSQPDSYSIADSCTQPEDSGTQNLPAISEIPNSTPIDTFDLHCGPNSAHSHPAVEYSYSQEYIGRPSSQSPVPTSQPARVELDSGQSPLHDESSTSIRSLDSLKSTRSSPNSVVAVSSQPATESILQEEEWSRDPDHTEEVRTDSQQSPTFHSVAASDSIERLVPREPCTNPEDHSDSDSDMATGQNRNASGKRLMRVVPAGVAEPKPKPGSDLMDIQVTMLPGDKHLGFGVLGGRQEALQPSINTITAGKTLHFKSCIHVHNVIIVVIPPSL